MNEDDGVKTDIDEKKERGFLASLFLGLLNDLVKFIIAFAVGTGAGAIICLYYGVPLIFSFIGGFIVLGLALAFMWDGLFS